MARGVVRVVARINAPRLKPVFSKIDVTGRCNEMARLALLWTNDLALDEFLIPQDDVCRAARGPENGRLHVLSICLTC